MLRLLVIVLGVTWWLVFGRDLEPPCGGMYADVSGWFAPQIYETTSTKSCIWIIKNIPGKRIKLQINDMNTFSEAYCRMDRIEVEDDDRLLATFCGNDVVPPMYTLTDHMYVLAFIGEVDFFFNASYSHIEVPKKQCGDLLEKPAGWFSAPDHDKDNLYDIDLDCMWTVNAERDRNIVLHFLVFDVLGEDSCRNGDYVTIRDGYDLTGRYCGSTLPPLVISDSAMLRIQLHTDYKENGEGFNVTYSQVTADSLSCGGLLKEPSGILNMANTNVATGSHECLWIISANEDKIAELTITKLEIPLPSDCLQNNLLVYDDEGLYKKFCESRTSEKITSNSNLMFVLLTSKDHNDVELDASYSQIYEFSDVCGGVINRVSGLITSPDSSSLEDLPTDVLNCFWIIEGEDKTEIELNIKKLVVNQTIPCTDYLLVYDGHLPKEKKCDGNVVKNPIRSISNILFIRFHIAAGHVGKFRARYSQKEALNKTCGGLLAETSGWIVSPDEDHNGLTDYNVDCMWTIFAKQHKVIYLRFSNFQLEYSFKCRYDYIQIYEEDNEAEVHCGDVYEFTSIDYLSDTNKLYVHFVTDGSINSPGFIAYYEEVIDPMAICESEVNSTAGWIMPLQHDYITTKDMDCHYILRMEEGKLVHFDPFEVDIIQTAFCMTEFVEIEETQKLCGHLFLPSFRSKSNTVRVHFKTLATGVAQKVGFNITYYQVNSYETSFEMELTDPTGWITFPFGDTGLLFYQMYDSSNGPYNLEILWTVIAGENEVIIITIMSVIIRNHMEGSKTDKLKIYERHRNIYMSELDTVSSKDLPARKFISEYHVIHVDFITDEWGDDWEDVRNPTSFTVKYEVIEDTQPTCSEYYSCLQGNLSIPRDKVCDETNDCFGADDERFCYKCPVNCTCSRLTVDCTGTKQCEYSNNWNDVGNVVARFDLYDGIQVLDTSSNSRALRDLQLESQTLPHLIILNISHCEISDFPVGYFRSFLALEVLDLSFNAIKRISTQMFRYLEKLRNLYLEGNNELITFETMSFSGLISLRDLKLSQLEIKTIMGHAFYQLQLNTLEISFSSIAKLNDDAFRDLQVNNLLLNTSITKSFSNLLFEGVQNVSMLATNSYMMCCIRPFYLPENSCFPRKPQIQSCHDLLGNERYLLWINGLVAILANMASIKHRFSSHEDTAITYHSLFVSNLEFSNLLLAVYVITIISADSSLRGNYFFEGASWLSGIWCKLARGLSSLSLMSGLLSILLITVGRYLVIKYPAGEVSFTRKSAITSSVIVWLVAFICSAIPLTYGVITGNDVFSNYGVCFGLSFNRGGSSFWLILLVIPVLINVLAFGFMLLGFAHAYKEFQEMKAKTVRGRLMRADDLRVSRNILVLVTFSIFYTTFVNMVAALAWNEEMMEQEMVAWVTIIVASLVSALNPFFYSLSAFFDVNVFEPSHNEQKRPKLCTKSEFEQLLTLMQSRCYLKPGTRKRGYICLPKLMTIRRLRHREIAFIALSLTRRITGLHEKGLVLGVLARKDVYVRRRLTSRGYGVVLICRTPQLINKPVDMALDIGDFGNILAAVVENYEDNFRPDKRSDDEMNQISD